MSINPKLIAAISSAVGLYLEAEQAALLTQQQPVRRPQIPVVFVSQFALAGRQAAMNARWTWQMRLPR